MTDPVYSRAAWRTRTCYEARIVYNIGPELIRDAVSPPAKRKKLARRQNQGRNNTFFLWKEFTFTVAHCPIPNTYFFRNIAQGTGAS